MWTGSTPWSKLEQDGRWTVELHAARGARARRTHFPRVRIEKLVTERRESLTPSDWPDFEFCYLGLKHISGQSGLLQGFAPTPGRSVRSPSGVFREGDVLYGRLRPYLNKVYAALPPVHTGICSGEFFVLTPNPDRVRTLFLRELLASGELQDRVTHMQFGSALPRLGLADLLAIEVPIPPLELQEEVEERLLKARSQLAECMAAAHELPRQIRSGFERVVRHGDSFRASEAVASSPALPNALPEDYRPATRPRRRRRRSRSR